MVKGQMENEMYGLPYGRKGVEKGKKHLSVYVLGIVLESFVLAVAVL